MRPPGWPPVSGRDGIGRMLLLIICVLFAELWPLLAAAQSPGNFSSLTTTGPNALGGTSTFSGDALMCSGHPWIDVRCNGATGDDVHDDTSAIQTTINSAITNGWPVFISAGRYKISSEIAIDYAGQAHNGFVLRSENATLDGASVASGPVLQVECSGGTPSSPTACFYFAIEGRLQILAATPAYAFVMGKADFSDQHNSFKIEHLNVNNASTAVAAGACQFNAVYDSQIDAVCDTAGGAAGMALEQVQFSRISGSATASGTGGRGLVLENGFSFSNTFFALDLEVSPTCLSITNTHNGYNTWISPYFNCATAVNAVSSNGNVLVNPQYAGNVINYGPQSTGITVIGAGSRPLWLFPSAATYTPAPIDDGLRLSSYNAPGTALTVDLPSPATLNTGWSMGFATDNGKGLVLNAPSGAALLYDGQALPTITMAASRYEFLRLENDGNNFRVTEETRNTKLLNGHEPSPWPTNWLFPSTSGYTATLQDDGNVLSSYNTASGLTVTLPPTTAIPTGWTIGFATDNGKGTTVNVDGTSGGHIIYPGSGASQTSISLASTSQGAYEYLALQYDGSGNFRVVEATPATMQALGAIGSASISHWSFPGGSTAYAATVADNGNVVSSFNSPGSFLTVTLPSATAALPMGWTIGLASDSNKTMSVQVNGTNGGHILWPGSGATQTSLSLAAGNYEFVRLSYDGSNFRVIQATPATAQSIGISGTVVGINRWNFPSTATYAAAAADNGNALSSYNTTAGLTVTLPSTTAIAPGWQMAFVTDNGKSMTVQVNATSGGHILYPAGATGTAATSITLAGINYELVWLMFDGSNFRLLSESPQTAAALKMLGHQLFSGATPTLGSGSGDCGTGPSIGGNDSVGRITVGSGGNGGKCTVTFATAWPNPPVCDAFDETTANMIRPTNVTTTGVAFAGTLAAGDSISYACRGF
jgi:hypothetical protein